MRNLSPCVLFLVLAVMALGTFCCCYNAPFFRTHESYTAEDSSSSLFIIYLWWSLTHINYYNFSRTYIIEWMCFSFPFLSLPLSLFLLSAHNEVNAFYCLTGLNDLSGWRKNLLRCHFNIGWKSLSYVYKFIYLIFILFLLSLSLSILLFLFLLLFLASNRHYFLF